MRQRPFLLFMPKFPTLEQVVGGTTIYAFELCQALARSGHRVHVWETQHPEGRRRSFHGGLLTAEPLTTQRRGPVGLALRYREMRRRLREAEPGTCFYQQSPSGFIRRRGIPQPVRLGPSLFRYARRRGLVVWAEIQDLSPEQESMLAETDPSLAGDMRIVGALQRLDARRVLPTATFWTPTSLRQQEALAARCRLDLGRSAILAPGVNPDLVAGLPDWTPPAAGEPWRVGYVGSFRDTALHLLRAATASFTPDELRLLVAGVGMRQALGDAPGVEVIDPAQYADFEAIARRVDVWVLAYEHSYPPDYTWELKLPMTLGSGRPLIRTGGRSMENSPWAPHLVATGRRPAEIEADLRALMAAPDEAAARARRGREAMLANHTWQARIDGLVTRLEEVVRRG